MTRTGHPQMAGFAPEWWPASCRNKWPASSEYAAGIGSVTSATEMRSSDTVPLTGPASALPCKVTGTKAGIPASAKTSVPLRAMDRHADKWCGTSPYRAATSRTREPGCSVSATTRAFSASGQQRRPVGPGRTSIGRARRVDSIRRSPCSSITTSPPPNQAKDVSQSAQNENRGRQPPLTDQLSPGGRRCSC